MASREMLRRVVRHIVLVIGACACGGGDDGTATPLDPDVPPITEGSWFRPDASTTWQWQLQGTPVNASYDVAVYDIDLDTGSPTDLAGRKVLCYFSAGSFESFRPIDVPAAAIGEPLDGFPDERWLDIRSPDVHRVMLERLDLARTKGCDGVEPDNVDAVSNDTGFSLTGTDQLAFNRFLANAAHERGLAVALKNDLDQIPLLIDYVDLALDEQCHEFDECELLAPFPAANKPAFVAEYEARFVDDAQQRAALCASSIAANLRTLILPVELDDRFRFSCDP